MNINPKKKVIMEYYNLEESVLDFYIITNYTNKNKRVSLTFWNTWDNFDEYITWMEKVLQGENNCIYEHIPEDLPFYFKYNDGKFYVYEWQDIIKNYLIEFEMNNIDLVYELYFSFRNFIESDKYNYKLWESITFEAYLEIKYKTIKGALTALEKMGHNEIIDLLNGYSRESGEFEDYTYNDFIELKEINNDNEKMKYIKNILLKERLNIQNGLCLRKLKSKYIEKYFNNIKQN
jgi:hypothetical protein